ncbi:MAG: alpha-L-fucosidase, partial [Bacteroidales bacterium]|nr:alpha-L-fucosidase [Bacteroidales bacterium]
MRHYLDLAAVAGLLALAGCGKVAPPEPYGAIPSPQQVEWQKMEMNMFTHFGPNTFTGLEWGLGTEAEDIFNPSALDCGQWAKVAKAAGFKGIIITGKHHDGFCLWPNPVSVHTVAQSPWKDGKGDVLKELSEACAAEGVKFGVYVSPWDRNDPHYGTPEYNDVFVKTLESVHDGRYGTVFEQWFDGANGEGPNGKKQVYDWPRFHETVLKYQPQAIMFSDTGPGCRWVGNESGVAGRTNWSTLNIKGFSPGAGAPPRESLNSGDVHGACWHPAETDVSIRPGWFWRESENDKVKSLNQLLSIYYTSVGRNSLLLLNVPPDNRGLIHEADAARLMEFRKALDEIFKDNLADGAKVKATDVRGRGFSAANIMDGNYDSYWATKDGITEASVTFDLAGEKTFNRVLLQEYIPLGQRVYSFTIEAEGPDGQWKEIASETTIGYKRIVPT